MDSNRQASRKVSVRTGPAGLIEIAGLLGQAGNHGDCLVSGYFFSSPQECRLIGEMVWFTCQLGLFGHFFGSGRFHRRKKSLEGVKKNAPDT